MRADTLHMRRGAHPLCSRRRLLRALQSGQAVIEALAATLVLASLGLAVMWLGRLQDVELQLSHASRRLAFAHAHQGVAPDQAASFLAGYVRAPGHSWRTRDGRGLLRGPADDGAPVLESAVESVTQGPVFQAGDGQASAAGLRADWALGSEVPVRAVVIGQTQGQPDSGLDLHDFDSRPLRLARHTAILRGDGAAASDAAVQRVLGQGAAAWSDTAQRSIALGQSVAARLAPIDAAWNRPAASWDWLNPWTGWIPEPHLGRQGAP